MKPLHVVILAAGEGKRMKSALPKVLQPIAGRPMLAHVIEAARALSPAGVHVVVCRYEPDLVPRSRGPDIRQVEHAERRPRCQPHLLAQSADYCGAVIGGSV